jgi:glucose/mannose-6-phosphate isomerase
MNDMLEFIRKMPDEIEESLSFEIPRINPEGVKRLLFLGMGGSAVSADLALACLDDLGIPGEPVRGYEVPPYVDGSTLAFVTSYSGNTEETLSAFEEAVNAGATVVALTTGGKLGSRAEETGVPVIRIPAGLPPRAALGWLFPPILLVLGKCGLIRDRSGELRALANHLRALRTEFEGPESLPRELAEKFYLRFPLLYASSRLFPVANRWRTQINENAKAFAHVAELPEMNHNEIAGIKNPTSRLESCWAVFLTDPDDHRRVRLRVRETESLIRDSVMGTTFVESRGDTRLERTFHLLYLGDYVSLYLAQSYGEDPVKIERIDELKRRLTA